MRKTATLTHERGTDMDIDSIEKRLNRLMQRVDALQQRGRRVPHSLKAEVLTTLEALERAENEEQKGS